MDAGQDVVMWGETVDSLAEWDTTTAVAIVSANHLTDIADDVADILQKPIRYFQKEKNPDPLFQMAVKRLTFKA